MQISVACNKVNALWSDNLGEKFVLLVQFFHDHGWLLFSILVSFRVSVFPSKSESARSEKVPTICFERKLVSVSVMQRKKMPRFPHPCCPQKAPEIAPLALDILVASGSKVKYFNFIDVFCSKDSLYRLVGIASGWLALWLIFISPPPRRWLTEQKNPKIPSKFSKHAARYNEFGSKLAPPRMAKN